ncbi:hypothetical protein AVEN_42147-1 [Araneus ventricosus]|uniref:Uncharacterized protein n=1 Tax=Araneus ventricosus TaxID=182803 RepID=A0A4Y2D470_ARAVE|nr:hypothetical protein AVEN_42147-1 [Araneus ventricosus]
MFIMLSVSLRIHLRTPNDQRCCPLEGGDIAVHGTSHWQSTPIELLAKGTSNLLTAPTISTWGGPAPSPPSELSVTGSSQLHVRDVLTFVSLPYNREKPYYILPDIEHDASCCFYCYINSLIQRRLFFLAPLKPGMFVMIRHELDSTNLGGHLPHPCYNLPLKPTEMGRGWQE